MKKSICILVAMLFCIGMVSCSTPGQEKSSLASEPVSQSEPESQSSAPSSLAASQPQEEKWVSPTGWDPYTSKALYEYYEANPELKEYYYTYMVPMGIMISDTWSTPEEIDLYSLVMWIYDHMTAEEKETYLYKAPYGLDQSLVPFMKKEYVEEKAMACFGVSAEHLRTIDMYVEENGGYYIGWYGFGEHFVFVLQQAQQQDNEIILVYQQLAEENFPEMRFRYEGDGKIYQLHIRLNEDGTFQYLQNILLDEGWQIPKAE